MSSTSRAAAQDAAVDTNPDRERRKAHAAVDYHRREVQTAEQGAAGARAKAEKFAAHAEAARQAVSGAEYEVDAAKERLAAAEAAVEALEGGDR